MRPRSAEPPRSPLLKRVQSAEKLTGGDKSAGGYHGDRKAYGTRRHTMEVPLSEGEGPEDGRDDVVSTGFVCVGEHGRQGLFVSGQKALQEVAGGGGAAGGDHHRSSASPQHRGSSNHHHHHHHHHHHSKEVVVMRKLALSERRDSFKKQEAVQEVSFDDGEEREAAPASPTPTTFKASWLNPGQQGPEAKPEERGLPGGTAGTTQQQKGRLKEREGL